MRVYVLCTCIFLHLDHTEMTTPIWYFNPLATVDSREMDTRRNIVGLCGLLVLHHQLFNLPEKKLTKQVWDLYKKV